MWYLPATPTRPLYNGENKVSDLLEIVDGKVIVTMPTGRHVELLPSGDGLMRADTALTMPEQPNPPTYSVLAQGENKMSNLFEIVDGKVIVTTSTGWQVECLPYGDDFMRAGTALSFPEKPAPPTYLLGEPEEGERQIRVPYTETSIDDEKTPAEDTEAWGKYLIARSAYDRETAILQTQQSLMKARVMIHKATRIIDPPDLTAWAKERDEFYGIPRQSSEESILFEFYTAEISKSSDDILKIMAGIMRATGVEEEVLDQFEINFRDTVGGSEGENAEGDSKDPSAETESTAQGLVDRATVESA